MTTEPPVRGGAAGEVPSLFAGVRAALGAFTDDFGRFVAVNLAWGVVAVTVTVVERLHPAFMLLAVVLVPTTAALARMSADTVRGVPARLASARDGFTHRLGTALAIGGVQLSVLFVAWINVQIGLAADSLALAVAGVTSAWAMLIVAVSAVTAWPLLMDPRRDGVGVRQLGRLALAVVLARPGRILAVVLLEAVIVVVMIQTIIGALLLPSIGVLVAAHVLVPVADAIEEGRR